jgi:isoquinoline 1-oxidoreductase subunit alpha
MTRVILNGRPVNIDGPDEMPLLWALRDTLRMTGTKFGCGLGLCGACTVLVEGSAARSCITPLALVKGKSVTTIEGVSQTRAGAAVQAAWLAGEVPQCGYCQSGQIMSATALLAGNKQPTDEHIDQAMAGNICRCGIYARIREGIKHAAKLLSESKPG